MVVKVLSESSGLACRIRSRSSGMMEDGLRSVRTGQVHVQAFDALIGERVGCDLRDADFYLRLGLLGDGDLPLVVDHTDDDCASVFGEVEEALAEDLPEIVVCTEIFSCKRPIHDNDGL